ncbi:MAG: hypothetical protein WBN83_07610 [Desulfoprunum sp.]|uniref:hypothetical protein n=1 Tax=Desulfoprunum sp. TaxID=2020866 RepID=UPI003C749AD9
MAKMNSRISALVLCFVCLMVLSTTGTSHAEVICQVKIESVYMSTPTTTHTGVLALLRNTTGATIPATDWANNTTRAFYVSKSLGNQGLALLLTSLSNKTKIIVNISGTAVNGSLLQFIAATQVPQ